MIITYIITTTTTTTTTTPNPTPTTTTTTNNNNNNTQWVSAKTCVNRRPHVAASFLC